MFATYGIYAVCALLLLFFAIYRVERFHHEHRLKTIPLRIWVNGSRGKSSVTRLIAAGLRAKGMPVIAKTTGVSPRFIIDNHTEEPIVRLGMANIREQVKILKKAFEHKPEALVFECMALRPDLQCIESKHIVQPTIVVITNVRHDHLDIMGPTLSDIRKVYIKALPRACTVFTTDGLLAQECTRRSSMQGIQVQTVPCDNVNDAMLARFPYIEHRDNIALALSVCEYCGISGKAALDSMINVTPDPGALRDYKLTLGGKRLFLINAMSANDPESTQIIWHNIDKQMTQHTYVLINCRKDRIDRSLRFLDFLKGSLQDVTGFVLTGEATGVLRKRMNRYFKSDMIMDLGGKSIDHVIERLSAHVIDGSLIFAIGNTVGYGMDLIQEIVSRGSA